MLDNCGQARARTAMVAVPRLNGWRFDEDRQRMVTEFDCAIAELQKLGFSQEEAQWAISELQTLRLIEVHSVGDAVSLITPRISQWCKTQTVAGRQTPKQLRAYCWELCEELTRNPPFVFELLRMPSVWKAMWLMPGTTAPPPMPQNLAEIDKIRAAVDEAMRWCDENEDATNDDATVECLVTLQQAAAMVSRSKKTLERRKKNMPIPKVSGGGGKPDEWEWSELRPWLEKEFERKLPERFPADRLRTS